MGDFLACAFPPMIFFFFQCRVWLSLSTYGNLLHKSFCSKRMVNNGELQLEENEKGNVQQHGKIRPTCPLGLPYCSSSSWDFGLRCLYLEGLFFLSQNPLIRLITKMDFWCLAGAENGK